MVDYAKIKIRGEEVPVSGEKLEPMLIAPKFEAFLRRIDPRYVVRGLRVIENIVPPNGKLLFSFLDGNVSLSSMPGVKQPAVVVVRGGSVAILVVITAKETGAKYGVLLKQSRFPIGNPEFSEIPAGMLDDKTKNFSGVAAKELQEETGIVIDASQLIPIGMAYTSPGLLDEFIEFYAVELGMPLAEIQSLQNRLTGNMEEGESICMKVGPLFEVVDECLSDCKSETAFLKYLRLRPHLMAEYSQYLQNRRLIVVSGTSN